MSKYLDENGLSRVWSNIKTYLTNNYQPKGSYLTSQDHYKQSLTAQTTQAVYPIKIGADGHITGYGAAVTIPNAPDHTSSGLTAQTTQAVYPIKIGASGHITSYGTAVAIPTHPSLTAQTTQAVYPIKIDSNGHISAYGTAVTIPSAPDHTSSGLTAQTTQAIYPIKIGASGHITAYGTAVTPLTSHQSLGLYVCSSASATTEVSSASWDTAYVNLMGGGAVKDSVAFVAGSGIDIKRDAGQITIQNGAVIQGYSDVLNEGFVDGDFGPSRIKYIWCGTQSQYNSLATKYDYVLYIIK